MTVIPYGLRILKTDTCELCKEYGVQDCKRCHLGNPYIDCEDYDRVNDTCKSNGACGSSHKNWKETDCEVKAWIHSSNVVATWTGSYPCLCHGEWMLEVDGKDYTEAIPKDYRTESMGTYGAYKEWRFRDGWDVEWSSYTDGLGKDDWIRENKAWLDSIPADPGDIYDAFQASDFRMGSCGGCI